MDDEEEHFGEEEIYEEEPVDENLKFVSEEIAQCFSVFDQKETGQLSSKFLGKALKSLGIDITDYEVDDLIETYQKDGSILFKDFRDIAMTKLEEIEPSDDLKGCFAVFDPEGEGVIPTSRLKKYMMTLGDPLNEAEAKELCKMGDPANKGAFVYDDVIPQLLF